VRSHLAWQQSYTLASLVGRILETLRVVLTPHQAVELPLQTAPKGATMVRQQKGWVSDQAVESLVPARPHMPHVQAYTTQERRGKAMRHREGRHPPGGMTHVPLGL
jgi:hypothetical protein